MKKLHIPGQSESSPDKRRGFTPYLSPRPGNTPPKLPDSPDRFNLESDPSASKAHLERAEKNLAITRVQLSSSTVVVQALRQQVSNLNGEVSDLKDKLIIAEGNLKQKDEIIKLHEDTIASLRTEVEGCNNNYLHGSALKAPSTLTEINKIQELMDQVEELSQQVNRQKVEEDELNRELDARESRLLELDSHVSAMQQELAKALTEKEKSRQAVGQTKKLLQKAEEKIGHLQLQQPSSARRNTIATTGSSHDVRSRATSQDDRLVEKEMEVLELQKELINVHCEINTVRQELSHTQNMLDMCNSSPCPSPSANAPLPEIPSAPFMSVDYRSNESSPEYLEVTGRVATPRSPTKDVKVLEDNLRTLQSEFEVTVTSQYEQLQAREWESEIFETQLKQLHTENTEYKRRIEHMEQVLQERTSQTQELKVQNTLLSTAKAQTDERLAEKDDYVEELKVQNTLLSTAKAQLDERLAQKDDYVEELQGDIVLLNQSKSDSHSTVEQLKQKLEEQNATLELLRSDSKILQGECDHQVQVIQDLLKQNDALKEPTLQSNEHVVKELSDELAAVKANLAEEKLENDRIMTALNDDIRKLRENLEAVNAELRDCQAQVGELELQKSYQVNRCSLMQEAVAQKDDDIQKLEHKLFELERALALANEVSANNDSETQLVEELERLETRNVDLELENDKLKVDLEVAARQKTMYIDIDREKSKSQEDATGCKTENPSDSQKVTIPDNLHQLRVKLDERDVILQSTRTTVSEQSKKIDDLLRRLEAEANDAQEAREQVIEGSRKLDETIIQLNDEVAEKRDLLRKLQAQESTLGELTDELSDKTKELKETQTALCNANSRVVEMDAEFSHIEHEKQICTEQMLKLNKAYEEVVQKYRKETIDQIVQTDQSLLWGIPGTLPGSPSLNYGYIEKEKEQLQGTLQQTMEDLRASQQQSDHRQAEIEDLAEKLQQMTPKVTQLEEKLKESEDKYQIKHKEFTLVATKLRELESEKNMQNEQVHRLEKRILEEVGHSGDREREVEGLNQELVTAIADHNLDLQRLKDAQKTIDELNKENRRLERTKQIVDDQHEDVTPRGKKFDLSSMLQHTRVTPSKTVDSPMLSGVSPSSSHHSSNHDVEDHICELSQRVEELQLENDHLEQRLKSKTTELEGLERRLQVVSTDNNCTVLKLKIVELEAKLNTAEKENDYQQEVVDKWMDEQTNAIIDRDRQIDVLRQLLESSQTDHMRTKDRLWELEAGLSETSSNVDSTKPAPVGNGSVVVPLPPPHLPSVTDTFVIPPPAIPPAPDGKDQSDERPTAATDSSDNLPLVTAKLKSTLDIPQSAFPLKRSASPQLQVAKGDDNNSSDGGSPNAMLQRRIALMDCELSQPNPRETQTNLEAIIQETERGLRKAQVRAEELEKENNKLKQDCNATKMILDSLQPGVNDTIDSEDFQTLSEDRLPTQRSVTQRFREEQERWTAEKESEIEELEEQLESVQSDRDATQVLLHQTQQRLREIQSLLDEKDAGQPTAQVYQRRLADKDAQIQKLAAQLRQTEDSCKSTQRELEIVEATHDKHKHLESTLALIEGQQSGLLEAHDKEMQQLQHSLDQLQEQSAAKDSEIERLHELLMQRMEERGPASPPTNLSLNALHATGRASPTTEHRLNTELYSTYPAEGTTPRWEQLEAINNQLQSDVDNTAHLQELLTQLRCELEEAKSRESLRKQQVEVIRKQLDSKNVEVLETRELLVDTKDELSKEKAKLLRHSASMQQQLEVAEEEIKETRTVLQSVQDELDTANQEIMELKNRHNSKERDRGRYRQTKDKDINYGVDHHSTAPSASSASAKTSPTTDLAPVNLLNTFQKAAHRGSKGQHF